MEYADVGYAVQHRPESADTIPFEVCGFWYFFSFSSYFVLLGLLLFEFLVLRELDAVPMFWLTKMLIYGCSVSEQCSAARCSDVFKTKLCGCIVSERLLHSLSNFVAKTDRILFWTKIAKCFGKKRECFRRRRKQRAS